MFSFSKFFRALQIATLFCFSTNSLAMAEVAVVINPANKNLWESQPDQLQKQIKDIFLGKREKFPDGTPIKAVDQTVGQSTYNEFYNKLANKDEREMNAYWSNLIFTGNGRPPKPLTDDSEVKRFITGNPAGIGYITPKSVDNSVKVIYTLK